MNAVVNNDHSPLQQKLQVSGDLKGLSEVKIQNTVLTKKNILKTQFSQFIKCDSMEYQF